MKTLFVLSDTHGNTAAVRALKEIMAESDYIVHLGDFARDIEPVKAQYPQKTVSVNGNCDFAAENEEAFFEAEGRKILAVHGHRFGVKSDLTRLYFYAKERGADIVLYGHTHRAAEEERNGVLFVNPGNLAKRETEKSYAYLVLQSGKAFCKIVPVAEKI